MNDAFIEFQGQESQYNGGGYYGYEGYGGYAPAPPVVPQDPNNMYYGGHGGGAYAGYAAAYPQQQPHHQVITHFYLFLYFFKHDWINLFEKMIL